MIRRYLFGLIFIAVSLCARERITHFKSTITINKDSSLDVVENITVVAHGAQIKQGIIREFPTNYYDTYGNRYNVAFNVQNVLLDGKPVDYSVRSYFNGKKLRIGNPDKRLVPGTYTYTITYSTNRQLGFYENQDELYWNVTGSGWRLPIDNVIAKVILPEPVAQDALKYSAYTGYQDTTNQWYRALVIDDRTIEFYSTQHLKAYQGFTLVLSFPKGIVVKPPFVMECWWFFMDNLHVLAYLIGALILCLYLYRVSQENKKRRGIKPTVPLFYPPKNKTPGVIRYIKKMQYDNTAFAAEAINMAVHGWLTVDYKPGAMWGGIYTLTSKDVMIPDPFYQTLFARMFKDKKSLTLDFRGASRLEDAAQFLEKEYTKQSKNLFIYHTSQIIKSFFGALIAVVAIYFLSYQNIIWLVVPGVTYAVLIFVGFAYLRSYTEQGFELMREINGFKMFLEATEKERMKLIGTPPTKTPELYEKYLPYAMALGVEDQWSHQFAPLFAQLEKKGHPYRPIWYGGRGSRMFSSRSFASGLSQGVRNGVGSGISSSSSRPGSRSGFGGGGRSGGGGGGGGGGGW